MNCVKNLKGFSYPLTPEGRSSIVGDFPWYYGTEYVNMLYRVNPDHVKKWLPDHVELGEQPDLAYVAFSKWWSVWQDGTDLPMVNPERTQYKEAAIWVGCSYKGIQAQMCLLIWVDNDFSMARGWMMGFPKKLGQIAISDYNPYNPGMKPLGIGSKVTGIASSHLERLMKGTLEIDQQISPAELPPLMRKPVIHLRHFPSLVPGAKPSVCELVKLSALNKQSDPIAWAGKGELEFYPSDIEEHMGLAPQECLGAFMFRTGYVFNGAEVLYDYTKTDSAE
jgi:acetoacetate decarboxylase